MNVLIVEDHPLFIIGTTLTIKDINPEATIQTATTFPEARLLLEKEDFNLVILDIDLPGGENLKMMDIIRKIQPEIFILVQSAFDEHLYAMPYLQAGADGFVSKKASPEEFKTALNTVTDGKKYLSYAVQQTLLANIGEPKQNLNQLTPSELQVMQLLIEGKWTKEIAHVLNLKQNTISTYKRRIFDKLNVRDSIELAKKMSLVRND
ncbi:MAG TPA: response regulator transcription factor [Dyadobacter sp.]|jgi:DNA-binding NarL/FixJ family response regulator|nr:response regulator transcription factor [Dyadobacter sp.]